MRQLSIRLSALLFLITAYLMIADTAKRWIALPGLGSIGFTLVFVVFSIHHCALAEGRKRAALFFATTASVSYAFEEIGVRTGAVFGPYHYGSMLGPKLGSVPFIIPLAWFMMIYPSWAVAKALLSGVDLSSVSACIAHALIAAMTMTSWDVLMDPGKAAAGNWTWENGGSYFGVPFHNYLGWATMTFLIYLIVNLAGRRGTNTLVPQLSFVSFPLIIYTLYGLHYTVSNSIVELRLVSIFTMLLLGTIALIRTTLIETH